ncbi:uncharacterized protein TRAVEDRAFT_31264 [Trametes versicolor FP-101664 SS1]|uniref:uncharacterized protein n=1 Tax=Trametes versicolor (strain FP-101664) TaxID=717944 RepID=UPI0004621FD9|nr:uncharacterized protein TRAVEDRAFT_31264 [Trametes versicolor FP-101664 SS1]EIW54101.1 hypothetical protein TRAVEDRAFT_31264 [Trametes versicolor FP-101664 SS1]
MSLMSRPLLRSARYLRAAIVSGVGRSITPNVKSGPNETLHASSESFSSGSRPIRI